MKTISYLYGVLEAMVGLAAADRPIAKTTGCGLIHTKVGGLNNFSINSSGGPRQFAVYLPKTYNTNVATPMIVSYHGHNDTMYKQAELSRFNDTTINPNMIAVFPQGLNGSGGEPAWESAPYSAPGVSDRDFTTDLLGYMRQNYCIDDARIYASGKSNGAGFCDWLACSPQGNEFAAFGMVSAALYTEKTFACCPARSPLPILEFHGTDDNVIPYKANASHCVDLPNIGHWLTSWAVRNGCSKGVRPAEDDTHNDTVHHTAYTCNGVGSIVQGYKLDGQKHVWPSKQFNDDNHGHHLAPIEASVIMMDFFSKHQKPQTSNYHDSEL